MTRLPAPVIAAQLALRAEDLLRELFPDAKLVGRELRWHGSGGAVCSMVVRGGKRGVWCNWADDSQAGDALELVHFSLFPDEVGRRDSLAWAARWLGMDTADYDPANALRLRQLAVEALQRKALQAAEERERKTRLVVNAYENDAQPVPLDGVIGDYLHTRGIAMDELKSLPRALRFTWRFAAGDNLPAMLAPIVEPLSGRQIGVHATYLHHGEDGVWRKAGINPAKKSYGTSKGGVIPLLCGRSGKPLSQAPEGDHVLIGEGIENSLAAALAAGLKLDDDDPRVIACVSVVNLPNLDLPPGIKRVTLVLDRDGENASVLGARADARQRFRSEGRLVDVIKPPPGIKDFSDYLVRDCWDGVR